MAKIKVVDLQKKRDQLEQAEQEEKEALENMLKEQCFKQSHQQQKKTQY